MELLSKIQHPNIISLLGYSLHGEARLLVYELMQNGSLETQLHGIFMVSVFIYLIGTLKLHFNHEFVDGVMGAKGNAKEKS